METESVTRPIMNMKKAPNPLTRSSMREPCIGASTGELMVSTDPVRIMRRDRAITMIEPSTIGPNERMVVHLASLNPRGRRAPVRRQRIVPAKSKEE